jgi:hypothetical protein
VAIRRGHFATITGKAFRPRAMAMGRLAWLLFALCLAYVTPRRLAAHGSTSGAIFPV